MIYIFGQGKNISVVYNGNTLTATQKQRATLILDKLPTQQCPDGYIARASLKDGKFEWLYELKEVEEDG